VEAHFYPPCYPALPCYVMFRRPWLTPGPVCDPARAAIWAAAPGSKPGTVFLGNSRFNMDSISANILSSSRTPAKLPHRCCRRVRFGRFDDVIFRRVGQVEIHHMGKLVDIQAASGDIGRDENPNRAILNSASAWVRCCWLLSP